MDRLQTMRTFCKVAETGSFSESARLLGISAPLVSRRVSNLEKHLGLRLFHRTTRQVELSEAGQLYYPQCTDLIEQLDSMEANVSGMGDQPSGLLRVSMPMDFGRLFLGPAVREFLSRAPGVRLHILYEDRQSRLLQEQVDVAIRIGKLNDSSLVALSLGEACVSCYASADYLNRAGIPATPKDLNRHQLLDYSLSSTPGRWDFENTDHSVRLAGLSRLSSNNGRALAEAACRGSGIARLPEFLVQDHLESGELTELLGAFRSEPLKIQAIYLERKFKPAKVSAFLSYLAEYFERHQDWQPRRT